MKKSILLLSFVAFMGCQKSDTGSITPNPNVSNTDTNSKVAAIADPGTNIWVYANDKVPINSNIFGINNDWAQITNAEYPTFAASNNANGFKIVRYPGGFDSEYYNWDNNTTPGWSQTPVVAGATVTTMKNNSSNYGIVVPIQNAMLQPVFSQAWWDAVAQLNLIAENAINKAGGNNIKIVELGNEWWLQYGGGVNRADKLIKYAKIAMNMAEYINNKFPNHTFKILVNGDYSEPAEFTTMKNQFTKAYSVIDGLALHTYTGYINDGHNIETLQTKIQQCSNNWNPAKNYVYCSEWAPSKLYNGNKIYMEAANIIPDIIQIYGRSGVDAAAYWPPTNPSIAGLGLYDASFSEYPCGQIFSDMAKNYKGDAVNTDANSAMKASAALQNATTLVIYVAGKDLAKKTASIKLNGFTANTVKSAVRFRPNDYNLTSKAAQYTQENATVTLDRVNNKVLFEVNGAGKYQIYRVILGN